jgi:hypothetical protein
LSQAIDRTQEDITMFPLLLLGGLGLGAFFLFRKKDADEGPSHNVVVFQGANDLWTFAVYSRGELIYQDPGPYTDAAAARVAGDNWLAQNVPG